MAGSAQGQSNAAGRLSSGSTVPGWDALIEKLRDLPDRMLARLPEPLRSDPQIQQEAARVALEAIASLRTNLFDGSFRALTGDRLASSLDADLSLLVARCMNKSDCLKRVQA